MMRVLVISNNVISKVDNNGKTIRSLLRGMSCENIAQFYIGANEYPDEEACGSFYRVTDLQVLKSIINFSFRTFNSHESMSQENEVFTQRKREKSLLRFIRKNAKNVAFLREILWGMNSWDTEEFNNWVTEFNPTIIFAVLGDSRFMHSIVHKLSCRYNLPVAVYFTDDYVITDNTTNIFQKLHLRSLRNIYKKTLKKADKAFVIGDYMRAAYTSRFNRPFGVLVNGINFNKTPNKVLKIYPDTEVVISFIGGIHLNRWETIVRLGALLKQIPQFNTKVKVFTLSEPDEQIIRQFNENNIDYIGALSSEQVDIQIANSHILLHVESFDKVQRQYTHFSISTKIPEYLSSNRGIIAFGPHEIASIKIFSDNNFGCVLTDLDDYSGMISKIITYLSNYNIIDFNRQYQFAKEHFNQDDMLLSNLLTDRGITPPPRKYLTIRLLSSPFLRERRAA